SKMPVVKLQSSDGEIFTVDVEVVKCSCTIKAMLETCCVEDDDDAIVPLSKVNSTILDMVLVWAHYHKDDPEPIDDQDNDYYDMTLWDADFINVNKETLYELINAANYLDIQGLLELTCKGLANMIKGRTPDEVRRAFNIKKDFSPEEEEQERKENARMRDM
ncbi:hypothetical protein KR018_012321, partial [Drosophila ironensis]